MNFIEFIGKPIDDINLLKGKFSLEFYDPSDIALMEWPYSCSAESLNNDFLMFLSPNKVIQAIYLYPLNEQFNFMNFSTQTTREEVGFIMGKPISSGQIKNMELPVNFDRYETLGVIVQFEFDAWWDSRLVFIRLMDNKLTKYF